MACEKPDNKAEEHLTNQSEAVLPGGVQEAEATPEKEQDAIAPLEDQASTLETVKKPNLNADEGPNDNSEELEAEEKQTTQVTEEEQSVESPEKARHKPIAALTKKCINKLEHKVPRKQLLPIGRKFGAGKQFVPRNFRSLKCRGLCLLCLVLPVPPNKILMCRM